MSRCGARTLGTDDEHRQIQRLEDLLRTLHFILNHARLAHQCSNLSKGDLAPAACVADIIERERR
jgi:hypothetical protein